MCVDDSLITGIFIADIGSIKSSLHNAFSMTDLGLLKQFLGLEIEQCNAGTKVIQSKYALDLSLNLKISECRPSKCPFLSGFKLCDFGSSPLVDNSLYMQRVGRILYLTHSWPDLEYVVGIVYRYMKKLHEIHGKAAKRILHYVQRTKHFGVHYDDGSPLELVGFTDSDWDGDCLDRNSTLGYRFILAHGPIYC